MERMSQRLVVVILVLFLIRLSTLLFNHCYYQSFAEPTYDGIVIHVVPHSHLDVGWLKTVDQYFYGLNDSIQNAGVQYIFDNVIKELRMDPEKKFVFVEMAYFERWYTAQPDSIKDAVRHLVSKGQLSFANGGWVMNDEACTHYRSTIDQMTLGRSFLHEHFRYQPKVSWQIDAFGHSLVQAELMNKMNTVGMIINRINYIDAREMSLSRSHEFQWVYGNNHDSDWIFTSHLYNHYSPPPGFCFDEFCADDPIVEDEGSPVYNAPTRAKEMIGYLLEQSAAYRTRHLLLLMGSDFHYQNAHHSFKNIDALMREIRKQSIVIEYSTPEEYMSLVSNEITNMSKRHYDFLPYCHRPFSCWSGFYTSRPGVKSLDRLSGSLLQSLRQLAFLSTNFQGNTSFLLDLEKAHAVLQHHDAITGTSKYHVTKDYILRVLQAILKSQERMQDFLMVDEKGPVPFEICLRSNISDCRPKNETEFSIILYNPLPFQITSVCYLPAQSDRTYRVHDAKQQELETDSIELVAGMVHLPERSSNADRELAFPCTLPAFGTLTVTVRSNATVQARKKPKRISSSLCTFSSPKYDVTLSEGGKILISNKEQKLDAKIEVEVGYYEGFAGDNRESENQSDGAYVFRPVAYKRLTVVESACDSPAKFVNSGHWHYLDADEEIDVNLTARIAGDGPLEVHGLVGSLVGRRDKSRTLVVRYRTNLEQKEHFSMDSNCRRTVKRLMCPADWFITANSSLAGCYYPVCAYIFASAAPTEISLITDRTQGGTVYYDSGAVIEMAVSRRSVNDDGLGMEERLDERYSDGRGVWIKFHHKLIVTSTNAGALTRRTLATEANNPPVMMLPERTTATIPTWKMGAIPAPINLLTVEVKRSVGDQMLLLVRLEHPFEPDEDAFMSEPVDVDLSTLWNGSFRVTDIVEMTLDGVRALPEQSGKTVFTFSPMMIRTFQINMERWK